MAFKAEVVPFALASATSSGTKDINASSGFGTPQAAFYCLSGSPNDSTALFADSNISIGGTDGTSESFSCVCLEDGQPIMDCGNVNLSTGIIGECDDTALVGKMGHSSFGTDKHTIEYDSAFNDAYRGFAILFAGADNYEHITGTVDSATKAFTTTGNWKPDFAIFWAGDIDNASGYALDDTISIGVACRGALDAVSEWYVSHTDDDNSSAMRQALQIGTAGCLAAIDKAGLETVLSIDSWDSNGFTLARSDASTVYFSCLAFKLPSGQEALCGIDTAPGSATSKSITTNYSAGDDDSEFALIVHTVNPDTEICKTDEANGVSIGAGDKNGNVAAAAIANDDSAGTAVAKSAFLDSDIIIAFDNSQSGGTIGHRATLTNLDSPDIDISYATSTGADYFGWLAVQAGVGGIADLALTQTMVGAGTIDWQMAADYPVSGTLSAAATVDWQMAADSPMAATLSGAATAATWAMSPDVPLAGTLSGAATADAWLIGEQASLEATLSGVASAGVWSLGLEFELTATFAGAGTIDWQIVYEPGGADLPLTATLSGAATATTWALATISPLVATMSGVATAPTWTLAPEVPLTATFAGAATNDWQIDFQAAGSLALTATMSGAGTISAWSIGLEFPLSAALSGAATVDWQISADAVLTATWAGASTNDWQLTLPGVGLWVTCASVSDASIVWSVGDASESLSIQEYEE